MCVCVFCLQERLLLSVLPAHLAFEMKTEMMERVRDPTLGPISHRPSSSTHFHSLYVKRHRNVRYVRTHSDTIIWEPEGRYQYLNNIGCPWVVYQIYCIHLAECNISGIPRKKANIIIIILDLDLKYCTNETTKKGNPVSQLTI